MRSFLVLLALSAASGCASSTPSEAFRARTAQYGAQEDVGLVRFLLDDFSGLSMESLQTFAVPWKVTTTALLLHRNEEGASFDERGASRLLERYGWLVPERIGNWDPRTPAPSFTRPLGIVSGMLSIAPGMELEVANNGCATCHAGRMFDARGEPTREVWIGLPNGSIDYEQYSRDVFRALSAVATGTDDDFLAAVRRAYPGVSESELRAIRSIVLPRVRDIVKKRSAVGNFVSFSGGQPGLTNGVATLKMQLGVLSEQDAPKEDIIVSIPSLAFRDFKTAVLWDGVYAPVGRERYAHVRAEDIDQAHLDAVGALPSIFTTGTLGISTKAGAANVPKIREVFRSTARAPAPAFPGPVDGAKADRGEALFTEHCQKCHGTYDRSVKPARLVDFPNRLVPQDKMGTDPRRWEAASGPVLDAFARSDFGAFVDAKTAGGYVAPILTSTWASAPYLHNGSVPTLWHFFHPESRPARFLLGGHKLDYSRMGLALDPADPTKYPAGYQPTSRPVVYDTSRPGHGAHGHEKQLEGLTEADKEALTEYLKLL
jgi:mono/diheme cytochrome c family protein